MSSPTFSNLKGNGRASGRRQQQRQARKFARLAAEAYPAATDNMYARRRRNHQTHLQGQLLRLQIVKHITLLWRARRHPATMGTITDLSQRALNNLHANLAPTTQPRGTPLSRFHSTFHPTSRSQADIRWHRRKGTTNSSFSES